MMTRNISIWLDSYDDIFSDFDPRPYSERVLSDDFIIEVRKVCKETAESINEFKLLLPQDRRNSETETIIIKRLQAHFKTNYHQYKHYNNQRRKKNGLILLLGMALMLSASYISSLNSRNFLINSLLIMIEPSGWFLVWYGLDEIFYKSKERKNELQFYSVVAKCKVCFSSI